MRQIGEHVNEADRRACEGKGLGLGLEFWIAAIFYNHVFVPGPDAVGGVGKAKAGERAPHHLERILNLRMKNWCEKLGS